MRWCDPVFRTSILHRFSVSYCSSVQDPWSPVRPRPPYVFDEAPEPPCETRANSACRCRVLEKLESLRHVVRSRERFERVEEKLGLEDDGRTASRG